MTRSVVTVVLVAHLFCLLVCFASNLAPSSLQQRLMSVLSPYVITFRFDLDATPYHLSHAYEDTNSRPSQIEVLPRGKQADRDEDWLVLQGGIRGGERQQRYRRLASMLAYFSGEGDINLMSSIAQGVCENYLFQRQVETQQIRCRRLTTQTDDSQEFENQGYRNASQFRNVYTANVVIDGKQVRVLESSGRTAGPGTESNGEKP